MANIILDNPSACWNKKRLEKYKNCRDCYYSQVKNGQWKGVQKCWNAGCLVYGGQM